MADRERYRPFTGDSTTRIRLRSAPLELVLCQIRWPELGHLQGDLKQLALQLGSTLGEYPVYGEVQELGYTITPDGVQTVQGGTVYQWQSIDGHWHVTFSRRFISFFCTQYTDYEDFSQRLRKVVGPISSTLRVPIVERVGVRYVNRIADPVLVGNLAEYVKPELLGYSLLGADSPDVRLVSSANQARYSVADATLQIRTGYIPAGETVDPSVRPLDSESWVMDLDAAIEAVAPLEVDAVMSQAGRLSDIAYDYFKLVTTEGFVREFGGAE